LERPREPDEAAPEADSQTETARDEGTRAGQADASSWQGRPTRAARPEPVARRASPPPPPPAVSPLDGPGTATPHPTGRAAIHTIVDAPSTGLGRLAVALLGWPPLGLAAANAIGESTGCGRFAASCGELSAPGTWLVQVAIVVLLLALPRLAAWSVHGSIAALVVGLPSAIVLSAGGGARQPDASTSVLAVVIALAWITGVAYAAFWPLIARRRSR
jgi:hypothetical protein